VASNKETVKSDRLIFLKAALCVVAAIAVAYAATLWSEGAPIKEEPQSSKRSSFHSLIIL